MLLLVLKLVLAPLLLAACSYAAWRWGGAIGGWIIGLPLISGPISVLLFLERGPGFAEAAARGSLLGLLATGAFCALYVALAKRARWWITLLAAYAVCLSVAWALSAVELPIVAAATIVPLSLAALLPLGRTQVDEAPVAKPRAGTLIPKMIVGCGMVYLLTTAAGALGPQVAGLLAPLPVLLALVTAGAHRRRGHEAARGVVGGALAGCWGGAAFFTVVALTPISAFGLASYALAVTAGAIGSSGALWLQREHPVARQRMAGLATVLMRRRALAVPSLRLLHTRVARAGLVSLLRG